MMKVTLDIYSGVPNPSWELSELEASRFLDRIRSGEVSTDTAESGPGILGFRGFIIEQDSPASDLPPAFRVLVPPPMSQQRETVEEEDAARVEDAGLWLLNTGRNAVDDELASYVHTVLTWFRLPAVELKVRCVIQNPRYNPNFWNDPAVRPLNNCYNYAMNYRSDTFAQPGRKVGQMYTALTCTAVKKAALADGNTEACFGRTKNVALVIWPNRDFHWYAKHSDGFWGHKPGGTAARNTDNLGRVIGGALNPQNCDRGPYTDFCGYLFSPVGIVVS